MVGVSVVYPKSGSEKSEGGGMWANHIIKYDGWNKRRELEDVMMCVMIQEKHVIKSSMYCSCCVCVVIMCPTTKW